MIRAETPDDFTAVYSVNKRAFERSAEADLVDVLRRVADPHVSLVATRSDEIIGHIFFSPVEIDSDNPSLAAFALAPMSVLPQF